MADDILFEGPKVRMFSATQGDILVDRNKGISGRESNHVKFYLGPDEISAFGALGCFEEDSSFVIATDCEVQRKILWEKEGIKKKYKSKEEIDLGIEVDNWLETTMNNSVGRGHGSVLDQNTFTYSIENITRAATLQLCLPGYLSHLQQSMRRATADRSFYVPVAIRDSPLFNDAKEVQYDAFKNYAKWGEIDKPEKERSEKAIPLEDARYPLPLYTKTNIQTQGDARELTHMHMMNKQGEVPSCVQETVNVMIERATSIAPKLFKERAGNREILSYYPSAQLYSSTNETINNLIERYDFPTETVMVGCSGLDIINEKTLERAVKDENEAEIANLKHVHFGFLSQKSLASYHQETRQRTLDISLESAHDAAKRGKFKLPPKFEGSEYADECMTQNINMYNIYKELVESGVPRAEAIGVMPHSLMIYDLLHVNGWNAIAFIGKRRCTKAQWEIRKVADDIAKEIVNKMPAFEPYAQPQCMTMGKCYESKPCKSQFKQ